MQPQYLGLVPRTCAPASLLCKDRKHDGPEGTQAMDEAVEGKGWGRAEQPRDPEERWQSEKLQNDSVNGAQGQGLEHGEVACAELGTWSGRISGGGEITAGSCSEATCQDGKRS